MRLGSFLTLLLALTLGGAAAFMTRLYLQNQHVESAPVVHQTVVVATQPLAFGAQLTRDNTSEIPWPTERTLTGAFPTKDELFKEGRRVVLSSIERNEPVLSTKITGPGQRATLSTLIEEGMRAVTVRVDDVRGVAGFVLPNDRVDVVLTREESQNGHGFADILLQNVKVLAVDQLVNDKTEKPTVARAVTLELNAFQAQKVILAQGVGRLSLILNKAGNALAERTTRVTVSDLGVPDPPPATETKPVEAVAVPAPAPLRDPNTIVNVVRDGHKREQYNVLRDGRDAASDVRR